ncbi:unnamed protein product, partial [Closterium sp. Naga37s-1]
MPPLSVSATVVTFESTQKSPPLSVSATVSAWVHGYLLIFRMPSGGAVTHAPMHLRRLVSRLSSHSQDASIYHATWRQSLVTRAPMLSRSLSIRHVTSSRLHLHLSCHVTLFCLLSPLSRLLQPSASAIVTATAPARWCLRYCASNGTCALGPFGYIVCTCDAGYHMINAQPPCLLPAGSDGGSASPSPPISSSPTTNASQPPTTSLSPSSSSPSSSSPSSSSSPASSSASPGLIIGIVVAVLLLLVAAGLILLLWLRLRRRRIVGLEAGKGGKAAHSTVHGAGEGKAGVDFSPQVCQRFSLADITQATNNWADSNRIGSGSYGDVYRGVCPYDSSVLWAVKRARILTKDFQREVAAMATKHHPNLVRLLGYCIEMNPPAPHSTQGDLSMEQIVVYELMAHGDLDRWVGEGAAQPLAVAQRVAVLIGAAHGIEYLYSFGIVHRDIKPANILLDHKFEAEIADFGLLREGEGTAVGSTRVMGTPGYVDPAYVKSSKATPSADVY